MATYYVDPLNGSDSNNGSSISLAFKSTAKSETIVAAGDTVKLLSTGTESLTGTNTITLTASGAGLSLITWQGCDSSGNPLTDGGYYTIDGSGMSNSTDTISTAAVKYRKIRNVLITNSKRYAVTNTADPSYSIAFESCSITNPTTACFGSSTALVGYGFLVVNGVYTGSGAGGSQHFSYNAGITSNQNDVMPIGCLIAGFNTCFALDMFNSSQAIQNCVFANNGTAIPGMVYAPKMTVSNCVFYGNTTAIALSDRGSYGPRFSQITSCSFVNNTTAIAGYDATICANLMSYNHYYNNTTNFYGGVTSGLHDVINVNPLFNSPSIFDFRLQSGSPLIGAGPRGTNIAGLSQVGSGGGVPLVGEGLVY